MDISALSKTQYFRNFKKDTIILLENDASNFEMFILLKGKAGVFLSYHSEKDRVRVGEINTGQIFGEMGFFSSSPRSATIVAEEDTLAIAIQKECLQDFINTNSDMIYHVIETLCERLAGMNGQISHLKKVLTANNISYTLSASATTRSLLFPPWHQNHPFVNESLIYSNFVYDKNVTCPICGNIFPGKRLRNSMLKSLPTTPDLRPRYFDFDISWYTLTCCPDCYYTHLSNLFENPLNTAGTHAMQEKLKVLCPTKNLSFVSPQPIDELFLKYYIFLKCVESFPEEKKLTAKGYLNLSWLYLDCGDMDGYQQARKLCLRAYEVLHTSTLMTEDETQRCRIILAELYHESGNLKRATELLMEAQSAPTRSEEYNIFAKKRLAEIKEMLKGEK